MKDTMPTGKKIEKQNEERAKIDSIPNFDARELPEEIVDKILCWPFGSIGNEKERQFIRSVENLRIIGYGRMQQIIQWIWDYKLEQEVAYYKKSKEVLNEK